jgi:DNA-binding NtrC family response regulator
MEGMSAQETPLRICGGCGLPIYGLPILLIRTRERAETAPKLEVSSMFACESCATGEAGEATNAPSALPPRPIRCVFNDDRILVSVSARTQLNEAVKEFREKLIEVALKTFDGNVSRAADHLGISRNKIYRNGFYHPHEEAIAGEGDDR